MVSKVRGAESILCKSTRKSRHLAQQPLGRAVTCHTHRVVQLRNHVGQRLANASRARNLHVIHVDLDGATECDMSAFDKCKSMGLSWSHNMFDGVLSGPFVHLIANPTSSFIRTQALWKTKVPNPSTLKSMNQMVSTFTMKQGRNSVLGRLIDDTEHRELLGTGIAFDPEHISLKTFTNFLSLMTKS